MNRHSRSNASFIALDFLYFLERGDASVSLCHNNWIGHVNTIS